MKETAILNNRRYDRISAFYNAATISHLRSSVSHHCHTYGYATIADVPYNQICCSCYRNHVERLDNNES